MEIDAGRSFRPICFYLFLLISFLSPISVFAEVQWAPFLNLELYGGQSTFSGDNDSPVSGPNGSLVFVPGMRIGERFSLLPSFSADYRKTRDVQELAGGGFLTQQQHSRGGSLKGIYAFTPAWKGKLYGSYRQQLYKETSDESWGDGLFDYDKTAFGAEVEREGTAWRSLRLGTDFYTTRFSNFQSLASQQFGAEINAGTDVLDFDAMDVSFGSDLALGRKALLSGYLLASNRDYADQKIVKRDGTYSGDTRQDLYTYFSLGYRHQLPSAAVFGISVESLAGLDFTYARLDSDQNNYDAGRLKFNENYYDYGEFGVGPRLNFRFKEKLSLGLGYMFSTRDYADRPVQAADGTYRSETISNDVTTFRWSLAYPLMRNLSVQAQGAFQNSDSNMEYESVYKYDYSSAHYFLGLSYSL